MFEVFLEDWIGGRQYVRGVLEFSDLLPSVSEQVYKFHVDASVIEVLSVAFFDEGHISQINALRLSKVMEGGNPIRKKEGRDSPR